MPLASMPNKVKLLVVLALASLSLSNVCEARSRYLLQALLFETTGTVAPDVTSHSSDSGNDISQDTLNKLLASGKAQMTTLPVLELVPGQDSEVDDRKTVSEAYPKQSAYMTRSYDQDYVGQHFKVRVEKLDDGEATIDLCWRDYRFLGWSWQRPRQPQPKIATARINAKMHLKKNQWHLLQAHASSHQLHSQMMAVRLVQEKFWL